MGLGGTAVGNGMQMPGVGSSTNPPDARIPPFKVPPFKVPPLKVPPFKVVRAVLECCRASRVELPAGDIS